MIIMRRYLEAIERMDLDAGRQQPRVRLFLSHRVVTTGTGENDGYLHWFRREEGFVGETGASKRIRIEAVREFDNKGKFRRERIPGSDVIDLGVPELFMIARASTALTPSGSGSGRRTSRSTTTTDEGRSWPG